MPQEILIVLLNGPLGVGKSTLGEVLGESIELSVTLDGDTFTALNPPPPDEVVDVHQTLALIVGHRLSQGYRRFIIDHYWSSPEEIGDLQQRLESVAPGADVRCYRLTLTKAENLRRIMLRRGARAIDEAEFEDRHFAEEYAHLSRADGDALGIPFDASDPPEVLAARMLAMLRLTARD